jgi:uncharacterized protein
MHMSSRTTGVIAKLAVAALALAALGACGQRETLLTVNASATTRSAPDLAVVTLGVVARGDTARAAQQAQTVKMNAVMEAARAAGVAEADVQTVGYGLEPIYVYPRNAAPRVTGYMSRNMIAVRLRDLSAVSGLIDATVAQGANELHGIQFTYQDEESSREAARAQALETARTRADRYATAAGMRVVGVDSITEPGGAIPPDRRRDGYAPPPLAVSLEQNAGAAIRPGELDNPASVTVVYVLR